MSKAARLKKREQEVSEMMSHFEARLREELHACANGHWGLFGQNDATSGRLSTGSHAARELLALADEIDEARLSLGYAEPFKVAERFKVYRAARDANAPGEPKLAAKLLAELNVLSQDKGR
jgi:uncharacterized protein YhaN